jgi:thymidylate kinase
MVNTATQYSTQPDIQAIVNAAYPSAGRGDVLVNVYCRHNPNGSVRWVWPARARQPYFLSFYHKGSFRAACMVLIMRVLFTLRLQRLLASTVMQITVPPASPLCNTNWALFTGTPGPNRKAIFRFEQEGGAVFVKVQLGVQAAVRMKNEEQAFFWLKINPIFGLITPTPQAQSGRLNMISDIAGSDTRVVRKLHDAPYATLLEWFTGRIELCDRRSAKWWQQSVEKVSRLNYSSDKRIPKVLVNKLQQLIAKSVQQEFVLTSPAHGDFTPWNMCVNDNELMVWDWEMFGTSYPALFDAFHFIYQDAILVRRENYQTIRRRIDAFFDSPCCRSIIEKNRIDLDILEQQYLITIISSLLSDWSRQEEWHVQTVWLMDVWNEALNDFITIEDPSQYRKLLLRDLFSSIRTQQYAWMKACSKQPWEISEWSDIDLCCSPQTSTHIGRILKQHHAVKYVKHTRYFHRTVLTVVLINGDILSIDCIHRFKRRALEYLDADTVVENALTNDSGIKYASPGDDLKYIWLFNVLNGATMNTYYRLYFISKLAVYHTELSASARTLGASDFVSLMKGASVKSTLSFVSQMPFNKGIRSFTNHLAYAADSLRAWFVSPGFTVTFSGIDGAGKSTVIEIMKERIARRTRRRVVVLRHRPSILPILSVWRYGRENAHRKAAESLPTTVAASGVWSSLFRFAYYYTDYFLGQFYVFFRHILRGEVVIYDRYYFDIINNPERSNLELPSQFTRLLYAFLLKPRYNFFLYAPVDVIYARKQELSKGIMQTVMNRYLGFFSKASVYAPKRYVSVQNTDLRQTIALVESTIFGGGHEKFA